MINWGLGFSSTYTAAFVDPISWNDIEYFDILSGSIKRNDRDLRQSADITIINKEIQNEAWIRIYLTVSQGYDKERVPLFTGLTTSPSKDINGRVVNYPLQCYSVLKPLQDILLPRGWFIDKNMNCSDVIKQLTAPLSAPVHIDKHDSFFEEYIIAENNETYLTMLDAALSIMNWRLKIDGRGEITISPYSTDSVRMFDSRDNDVLETNLSVNRDWYGCPNVIRVISGEDEYIEYDNSDSPYSILNRGREIWTEDSNCNLTTGENLEMYAKRRLRELQNFAVKVSYTRSYDPNVYPTDIVRLNYPETDISGLFYIESQSIDLGYGAKTREEVIQL